MLYAFKHNPDKMMAACISKIYVLAEKQVAFSLHNFW
jgi:hypothetical protein